MIGRCKVAIAHDYLRRVNPWTDVTTLRADVAALDPGRLASLDVVVVGVDNERARYLATRRLRAVGVPYVDIGVRADLWIARVTCIGVGSDEPCLVCGWTVEHLVRAGVDAGMPCDAVVETGDGFPSTLVMGHAAAALAAREVLCLADVVSEPAHTGEELRLDLRRARLERFCLSVDPGCASDHVLAGPHVALDVAPASLTLGELFARHGAVAETKIVLAAGELARTAVCDRCSAVAPLYARVEEVRGEKRPQPRSDAGECPVCDGRLIAVRRVSRLRWGDADLPVCAESGGTEPGVAGGAPASVACEPASRWFHDGDVFALEDEAGPRVLAFAPVPPPVERGVPWDGAAAAERFARLPASIDLARVRAARLGIIGLGNVGAAVLAQLAPLPWRSMLLVDRDVMEGHNVPAHAIAAGTPEPASDATAEARPSQTGPSDE
jgi:hypothetical protein